MILDIFSFEEEALQETEHKKGDWEKQGCFLKYLLIMR